MNELPLKYFEGEIVVVYNFKIFNQVIEELKKEPILGFDTETRPNFKKGDTNKVALLQLSTEKKAYLFKLKEIGLPTEMTKLLRNPQIIKVGVAIHDDIKALQKLNYFHAAGFVDLQNFVKQFGIECLSLKKLSAIVLNFRISKVQQLSNWESQKLTSEQQIYAATDAWVGFKIYKDLVNYQQTLLSE
jgi:ribonuclease D